MFARPELYLLELVLKQSLANIWRTKSLTDVWKAGWIWSFVQMTIYLSIPSHISQIVRVFNLTWIQTWIWKLKSGSASFWTDKLQTQWWMSGRVLAYTICCLFVWVFLCVCFLYRCLFRFCFVCLFSNNC